MFVYITKYKINLDYWTHIELNEISDRDWLVCTGFQLIHRPRTGHNFISTKHQ